MDGFHIGRSERGRYLNGWVSEARVWNVARTPAELEDCVCYVDPTTPGLVAYWSFDGTVQEDGSVQDLTGHVLSPNRWFVGYQPTICYNKTDYVLLLKKTIA